MSSESSNCSSFSPLKCYYGENVSLLKFSTSQNPGRRFFACKKYDHSRKIHGRKFFKWYDIEQTNWQRDIINQLVIEKQKQNNDIIQLRRETAQFEEDKKMLKFENDNLKIQNKILVDEIEKLIEEKKGSGKSQSLSIANEVNVPYFFKL
ncbi:hypothetical protein RND81_10G079900 [Saponaria officinalis]|uniref:GRF-type domain-containing protein n=1 Tax=Saponaria officinalis TaxID=3572 RepID=A0AAW1I1X1_SAPOF